MSGISSKVYRPADIIVTWRGITLSDGFPSDADFIVGELQNDQADVKSGLSGRDSTIVVNDDYTGLFTATLRGASQINTLLQVEASKTRLLGRPALGTLLLQDFSGLTLIKGFNAFIMKIPPYTGSPTEPNRSWVLKTPRMIVNLGGNLEITELG